MAKLDQRVDALERTLRRTAKLVVVQRVEMEGRLLLVACIDGRHTYQGADESEDAFEHRVGALAGSADDATFVRIVSFAGAGMKYGEDDYARN